MCKVCEAEMLVAETYGYEFTIVARAGANIQMTEDTDRQIADRHGLPFTIVQELRRQMTES
jgi:hypothetical protein